MHANLPFGQSFAVRRDRAYASPAFLKEKHMSDTSLLPVSIARIGLHELRKSWGWILAIGILLIIIGTAAIGRSRLATFSTVVVFGWMLIIGGALQAIHAFATRAWGGFFVQLLGGLLALVVGFLVVAHPAAGALTVTLLIAAGFMIGGMFRIAAAIAMDLPHRGWVILNGLVTLALGVLIWRQWPVSGLWVIGLFIGIDFIFTGWSLVMLAMVVKNPPRAATR